MSSSSAPESESQSQESWGHLAFLAGILGFLGLYLWDSWQAASGISNLIFILPVTLFSAVAIAAIAIAQLRSRNRDTAPAKRERPGRNWTLALCVAGFGAYVLLLPYLGFDVGTFIFVAAVVFILGERRPLVCIGFSLVFTLLTVFGLMSMIPTPIPTLLL